MMMVNETVSRIRHQKIQNYCPLPRISSPSDTQLGMSFALHLELDLGFALRDKRLVESRITLIELTRQHLALDQLDAALFILGATWARAQQTAMQHKNSSKYTKRI